MVQQQAKIPESHVSILENARMAFMSTIRHKDGYISTNPVGFYWDGEYLWFSTLKDRVKYPNLQHHSQLTVCVVDPEDGTRYIEIRGTAELADDADKKVLHLVFNRDNEVPQTFELDSPGAQRVSVKLIPQQVSTPLLYGGKMSGS